MGKIIAVVSGKGGTGKTSFTANVGLALAALGCHTLCLDCDITLRNLDLALGLSDRALMDFSDVIAGRCTLEDAVVQHPKYPKLHLLTAPLSARPVPIAPEQMKALLDRIRQGHPSITLHVYRKNRGAVAFYQREGFTVTAEAVEEGTGETEYTMVWQRDVFCNA